MNADNQVTFSAEKEVDLDAAKMWTVFGDWKSLPEFKEVPSDLVTFEGDGIGSTVTIVKQYGDLLIEELTALDDKAMTLKYKMNEFGDFPILSYECTMEVSDSQGGGCFVSWSGSAAYHNSKAAKGEEASDGKDSFAELVSGFYGTWIANAAEMAKAS